MDEPFAHFLRILPFSRNDLSMYLAVESLMPKLAADSKIDFFCKQTQEISFNRSFN